MADVAWMLLCVLWQIRFVSGSQSCFLCLSHGYFLWLPLNEKKKNLHLVKLPILPYVFQTYVDYMTRLYEREIKDFFEVAKIKMAGTSKDGKGKFGKTSIKTFLFFLFVY